MCKKYAHYNKAANCPPGLALGWMAHPQEVGLVLQGWFLTFISCQEAVVWDGRCGWGTLMNSSDFIYLFWAALDLRCCMMLLTAVAFVVSVGSRVQAQ